MRTVLVFAAAAACGWSSITAAQSAPSAATEPAAQPAGPTWQELAHEFGGTPAATKPSRDAQMSFSFSTEIVEIPVRGGQRVKQGELLVRARDSEVKTALDQQRALAENELEIQGAEKQVELTRTIFERIRDSGHASPLEFDQRRIEAEISLVQRDQALFNREQQRLRLAQLEAQYERFQLLAPFDGIIDEVTVDLGQGVTEQDKVLRIVNIDKLWLDPAPKTTETLTLRLSPGSPAWVLIDLPGKPLLARGKVIEVSPVADPVSLTRRIRVEIENPDALPPGTQAMVRFTEPTAGKWASLTTHSAAGLAPAAAPEARRGH